MVGIDMGIVMGMISCLERRNERNLWNVGWHESEYGMLECCISGGCAGLGDLHILITVMIDDSNTRRYKG